MPRRFGCEAFVVLRHIHAFVESNNESEEQIDVLFSGCVRDAADFLSGLCSRGLDVPQGRPFIDTREVHEVP